MAIQIDWPELLCIAREHPLVLHYRQSFCLFPGDGDLPLSIAILTAGRNFIAYQIRLVVDLYYPPEPDTADNITGYLNDLASLVREGENPRLFIVDGTPVSPQDARRVLSVMKRLPEPPETVPEKIHIVHGVILRLLDLCERQDEQTGMRLYRLAAEWMHFLGTDKLQLFAVQKPLEYAGMHLKQHICRVDRHAGRSVEWGREYDSYYRKHLEDGLCEQTARARAREKFCIAHPPPITDEELLCDYASPGTSRQSLHKYHQAFLQFQARESEEQSPCLSRKLQ